MEFRFYLTAKTIDMEHISTKIRGWSHCNCLALPPSSTSPTRHSRPAAIFRKPSSQTPRRIHYRNSQESELFSVPFSQFLIFHRPPNFESHITVSTPLNTTSSRSTNDGKNQRNRRPRPTRHHVNHVRRTTERTGQRHQRKQWRRTIQPRRAGQGR